jgi:diketogulonate reductase-like aldo/keto reductase
VQPFKVCNLNDPTLASIASHDATAAHVIVAWHIAHGVVVTPKSTRTDRIVTKPPMPESADTEKVTVIDGLSRVARAGPSLA